VPSGTSPPVGGGGIVCGMDTHRPRYARLQQRIAGLFNLRRGELAPVLVAGLFFFCILTALQMLRPARDALGLRTRHREHALAVHRHGAGHAAGESAVRLAGEPAPRLQFIAATYGFFACSLAGFWACCWCSHRGAVGARSGQVFYVWFSVFNLFATMVFWACWPIASAASRASASSADRGRRHAGRDLRALARIAAFRAAGYACAVAGRGGLPVAGIALAWWLVRIAGDRATTPTQVDDVRDGEQRIGGSAWAGLRAVFSSPYLLGIAGYVIWR
jgi:AAA family ATP:ADP antiporter